MLHKTRGIVLHYIKYGESSIIAHIYTESFGRQAYIINGIRSKRSSIRLSHFQPLTILDLECYYKPGRDIQRIKEIKNNIPLIHIQNEINKSTVALFIAEILYKTLHEAESNHTMFEFLASSIQFLDVMTEGVSNFHLVFLIQFSKYLGIFPQRTFQVSEKQEVNEKMLFYTDDIRIFSDLPQFIKITFDDLNEKSFQDLDKINIKHQNRQILLEKLLEYYKLHFENIGQVKSLQIMKDIFH